MNMVPAQVNEVDADIYPKTGYNQDNAGILKYYQRKSTQITQTITQSVPI